MGWCNNKSRKKEESKKERKKEKRKKERKSWCKKERKKKKSDWVWMTANFAFLQYPKKDQRKLTITAFEIQSWKI